MSVSITGPPAPARVERFDRALLERRARRVLRALGHGRSELSVALVDDTEIARLNRAHRKRRGPTDVLSYSLLEGEHSDYRGVLLGDVVISLETARRQARAAHRSLDTVVFKLMVHGILHLLGRDHERDDEARVMRAEERELLARCG